MSRIPMVIRGQTVIVDSGRMASFVGDPFFGISSGLGLAGRGILGLFKKKVLPQATTFMSRLGAKDGFKSAVSGALGGAGLQAVTKTGKKLAPALLGGAGVTAGIAALTGREAKKRRRMNVTNPKALRRSMRRVEGFARIAKRTISFTKRVRMKKRRKAA